MLKHRKSKHKISQPEQFFGSRIWGLNPWQPKFEGWVYLMLYHGYADTFPTLSKIFSKFTRKPWKLFWVYI